MATPSQPAIADDLRRQLAARGVPLFEPIPRSETPVPAVRDVAALVAALASSGDARLEGSIPCLVSVGGERAREATEEAARTRPELRVRLGWLYRLARALATSRAFDLERLLGVGGGFRRRRSKPWTCRIRATCSAR